MAARQLLVIACSLFGVLLFGSLSAIAAPATAECEFSTPGVDNAAQPVLLVQCCEGGARPEKGCGNDAACPGTCTSPATAAGNMCNGDNQCGRCEGPTDSEPTHGTACQTDSACAGTCSNDPSIRCVPGSGEGSGCPEGGSCEAIPCVTGTCGDIGTCTGLCERPKQDITPDDPASATVAACP
jgi:hypothetical protein